MPEKGLAVSRPANRIAAGADRGVRGGLKEMFKIKNAVAVLLTLTSVLLFAWSNSAASDGGTLYREHCSGCHSSIQDSGMKTISQSDIAKAIQKERKMKNLKFLSDGAMVAIAEALNSSAGMN